jgi:hypothetical protein
MFPSREWRHSGDEPQPAPLTPGTIGEVIADALLPVHFFAAAPLELEGEHLPSEEIPWEIFQGHLLDAAQTRQRRTFEAWNVHAVEGGTRSAEPLLAVKLDLAVGELHVTRGLLCYVWEGYHAGDNVYLSRETTRWVRELVGTVALGELRDTAELRAEVAGRLFQAVVGLSRLPLTSVESPLPDYSLGRLAYFYRSEPFRSGGLMRSWRDLLAGASNAELSWTEKARLLEVLLRAAPAEELLEAAGDFGRRWGALGHSAGELPELLREVFNGVSLSPWTDFAEKVLCLLRLLVEVGLLSVPQQVDFLGYLLRQLGRHLTAYDLITFHHRGANYPDALLLDLVLKEYLRLIEAQPELFTAAEDRGRMRRRALRQGWLLRRHYEGRAVPDAPTSPGENARVLPPPHRRVPDEQLLNVAKRSRRLYDGDPLPAHLGEQSRRVLRQSLEDLHNPEELRELGMAVFIDRPLGVLKSPAEPDQTLLLSYEAFSKALAARRLGELARDAALGLTAEEAITFATALEELLVSGLPVQAVGPETRPVVSITDALKVSEDFVLLRTLPRGVRDLLDQYDFSELRRRYDLSYLEPTRRLLVVRGYRAPGQAPTLVVYDRGALRLVLEIVGEQGYVTRGGVERPAGGLRVLTVDWIANREGQLVEYDVRAENLTVGGSALAPRGHEEQPR